MDPSFFLAALHAHLWIALLALFVWACVRVLKSDTKIPIDINPRWRQFAALSFGLVLGVLEQLLAGAQLSPAIAAVLVPQGTDWYNALIGALSAGGLAIVGHEAIVEGFRNGKDVPLPKFMLNKDPDAPPPSKPRSSVTPGAMAFALFMIATPPLAAVSGVILGAGALLVGCGNFFQGGSKLLSLGACVFNIIGDGTITFDALVAQCGGDAIALAQFLLQQVDPAVVSSRAYKEAKAMSLAELAARTPHKDVRLTARALLAHPDTEGIAKGRSYQEAKAMQARGELGQ